MTNDSQLEDLIRAIPEGLPAPGILFRDITPLLQNANPTAVLDRPHRATKPTRSRVRRTRSSAIESRGFLFGAPLPARSGLPLVPVRKPGKLPAELMTVEYAAGVRLRPARHP